VRYRVGEYCIDAELFEVRRGERTVECQAQVFNLIVFLIRHRDRVLPRDELLRTLWSEARVDDASLATAIKAARRVLGDTGRSQSVIATVWKRGYRFVAPVEELGDGETAAAPAPAEAPAPPVRSAGERRQLTALACDLVDALALPEDASAEDVHATVLGYRSQVGAIISACGGSLAPSPGDELLAYFGYPEAHEDDPQRAVHAALRILESRPALSIRIGIDSGEVAIAPGDPAAALREPLVFGRALNRAQRIQERAQPGTVLVSGATLGLLRGAFETESLETTALPGSRPEVLHRVLRGRGEPHALDRVHAGLWSPLVGRADELRRLRQAWSHALRGQGRVVWISGDAGVGKSRLLRELRARIESDAQLALAFQSSPLHLSSPFHPIVEGLRALPGRVDAASVDEALARLDVDAPQDLEQLRAFLSPDAAEATHDRPEDLHERALALLIRVLVHAARARTLLVSVEDLHWSDPSTLELLSRLVDQVPGARMLLLLTARTHFVCPWLHRAHVQRLEVAPLDREQTQELARSVGGDALPAELVPAIAQRSDGLPLFVEELTRSALAEGPSARRIPATLQDALTARLDRVPGARAVAQVASVIGRRFAYVLLRALDGGDEARLGRALTELLRADLLHQEGTLPEATFVFRHALIRDAAYQSLLRSERERLHRSAARLLESSAEGSAPEVIAYHLEEAGELDAAIERYREAGLSATRRQADREALAQLEHALGLLDRLPPSTDRRSLELALLLALSTPMGRARGYQSRAQEQLLRRAFDLACELGDEVARFHALSLLVSCYSGRGEMTAAIDCARDLVVLADASGQRERRLVSHLALAIPLLWCAEWKQSLLHAEQTLALCADGPRLELADLYGWDQEVMARLYAAYAQWVLGKPDSALHMNHGAIELARGLAHPPSLAQALAFTSGTHLLRREPDAARRCADDAIRLASQHGLRGPLALAQSVRAWTVAAERLPQGDFAGARPGFGGLSRSPTAPGAAGRPLIFGALAETYLAAGQVKPALECVQHCLELLPPHPYFLDAELYRLHGECLLAGDGDPEVARARLHQALDCARQQEALALELRAAMSLWRLDRDAHGATLREVVERHVEGFETGDLRAARELLGGSV
jgi:DNA-binding winged helix-turn-helix (wHTH) protein/tetratricopeptide (TPR) repeat protein